MSRLDVGRAARAAERAADRRREASDRRRRQRAERVRDDGQRRPLAIVHVPKSAGSSVVTSVRSAMPEHRWAPWIFDDAMLGPYRGVPVGGELGERLLPSASALDDHDAAAGHFAVPTLLHRFDAVDLVLVAREPRSRLLSHYEFWRHWDEATHVAHLPWTSSRTAVELDFTAWLEEPSVAYQTDNLLVRQLLGPGHGIPDHGFIAPEAMGAVARRAVDVVRTIGWVGLVEQGEAMWRSLGERVGADLPHERQNPTLHRADLPTDLDAVFAPHATRLLAARTAADAVVWRAIATRVALRDPVVEAEVAWSRRLGDAVRSCHADDRPTDPAAQ